MSSLIKSNTYQTRVSSVLNKDTQQYGKNYIFDGNEETCWCSEQGLPQWVAVAFQQDVHIKTLAIQFQGGFVGKDCEMVLTKSDDTKTSVQFYPNDVNTLQTFDFKDKYLVGSKISVKFLSSTDFFGRIIIYKMDIIGEPVS